MREKEGRQRREGGRKGGKGQGGGEERKGKVGEEEEGTLATTFLSTDQTNKLETIVIS